MKLSILLPTRNRPELACRTIQSIRKDFGAEIDYEIVVADNSDLEYRLSNIFDRAVYLPPEEYPLTMWDNWERAYQASSGDWLMVLNDKSEIVPGALAHLQEAMSNDTPLSTWNIRRSKKSRSEWIGATGALEPYRRLFRYWDGTDVFPHGPNMLWKRDLWEGRLFEPINPDYRAGMRLLKRAEVVNHISAPITYISPDHDPRDSTAASIIYGLSNGEEFKRSLGDRKVRIHDHTFPIDYIVEDLEAEGIPVDRRYIGARYLKHLAMRLRKGIMPSRRQLKRAAMIGPRNWQIFLGDVLRKITNKS